MLLFQRLNLKAWWVFESRGRVWRSAAAGSQQGANQCCSPVLYTQPEICVCAHPALCVIVHSFLLFEEWMGITRTQGCPTINQSALLFPRNWSIPLRGYLWSIFHRLPHLQTSSEVPLRHQEVCMCITASLRHNSCPTIDIFSPFGTLLEPFCIWLRGNPPKYARLRPNSAFKRLLKCLCNS